MLKGMSLLQTLTIIEKEGLANLHFAAEEVLSDTNEKRKREADLYRAMILGNEHHHKVKIVFMDEAHNPMQVETTVWHASDKYVLLKGARTIPVQCIYEVVL
jgi:hypothetical protein